MQLRSILVAVLMTGTLSQPLQAGSVENARTARRVFLELMAQGHTDQTAEIFDPQFVAHEASANFSRDENIENTLSWRKAIPDLKVTVQREVAEKDLVAVHWRATGINSVAVEAFPGKGDRLGVEGMTFFRFAKGRIVEEWSVVDVTTLRKQLGDD